jgi:hypothetical protein
MNLSPEDKEKIEEHTKAIAKILHQNTPSDKLKTFEDIETILREEIQEQISPEIAKFFFRNKSNQNRKSQKLFV